MDKFKDKIETQSLNSKMGTIEIIQSEQRENRSKEVQTALKENPKPPNKNIIFMSSEFQRERRAWVGFNLSSNK